MNGEELSTSFAEMYGQSCQAVATYAQEKLGRALSLREQRTIQNSCSLMFLEMLAEELSIAQTVEAVANVLAQWAPTSDVRLQDALNTLIEKTESLLARRLLAQEQYELRAITTFVQAHTIAEQLIKAAPTEREALFSRLRQDRNSNSQ